MEKVKEKNKKGLVGYPIGDFLVRLKNTAMARKKTFSVRKTKLIKMVADTLKKAGFLDDVRIKGGVIEVDLTYRKKEPVILDLKLISKPGMRVYMGVEELESHKKPSDLILSTSKGVLLKKEALKKRVGGEVIVEIL